MLQDQKIYCLQVCLCIFQCENCTGWGGEGLQNKTKQRPAVIMHPVLGSQRPYTAPNTLAGDDKDPSERIHEHIHED